MSRRLVNTRIARFPAVLALLSTALVNTACATPAPPGIEVQTVTVYRDVQRPCPVTKPVRPAAIGKLPTDLQALAAVLGAKLAEWSQPGGYGDRAEAAIETCTRD